jgi:hypothetical protein
MPAAKTLLPPRSYDCSRVKQTVTVSRVSYSAPGQVPILAMANCSGRSICGLFPTRDHFLAPEIKGCPYKDALDVRQGGSEPCRTDGSSTLRASWVASGATCSSRATPP